MTILRSTSPSAEQVTKALDGVQDPEIHRPITELGMVKGIDIARDGTVLVEVWLTGGAPVPYCDRAMVWAEGFVRKRARKDTGEGTAAYTMTDASVSRADQRAVARWFSP